jgi:hypothetical protein
MQKRVLHEQPRGGVKLKLSLRCDNRYTFRLKPGGVEQTHAHCLCAVRRRRIHDLQFIHAFRGGVIVHLLDRELVGYVLQHYDLVVAINF